MFRNRGMRGEMSEVYRSEREVHMDWRVPRFLDLSNEARDFYESPPFDFYDARWNLSVWPNFRSRGKVNISFSRGDDENPYTIKTVTVSVGMRGSDGRVDMKSGESEWTFTKGSGYTLGDICTRAELRKQKDRLMAREALIIVCKIKVNGTTNRGALSSPDVPTQTRKPNALTCKCQSLDKQDASTQTEVEIKEARVPHNKQSSHDKQSSEKQDMEHKVLEDMGKLLDGGNKSDVTVQVQEAEFRVHSSVLCARSPVLSAMLEHDTAERNSRRIHIEHCQPEVFEEYLRYLYTGSVKSLSQQTVFGLYRVADQYLAEDLKWLCLEHIQNTLCVQTFCETVKLAVTHGERDLLRLAVNFATQNFSSIVISVEWQNFISEYPIEANEILVKCFGPRG